MWEPDNASLPLEQLMEEEDLPESDRDEVRRFAEFLALRKQTPKGTPIKITAEMKRWLTGAAMEGQP